MTLRQLEAFFWAASSPSFAAAAQRLHLTVSSLSKRLGELESSLGQPLFDRSGHRAVLTPLGERLLPEASDLLQRAQRLRQAAGGPQGLQGRCRIGAGELSSITWLPGWVQALTLAHPALQIEVEVAVGEVLAERLLAGSLDLAVIAGPARRPELSGIALGAARFALCASPRLARSIGQVDAASLPGQTLVSLSRGSGVTQILDDWLDRTAARPRQTLTSSQWGLVAGLVAGGAGIGILPAGLAQALERRRKVRVLASSQPLAQLAYSAQCRHGDPRPLVSMLRETCRAAVDFDLPSPFF